MPSSINIISDSTKPFGTVYVHHLSRETWAVEATSDEGPQEMHDRDTACAQPPIVALELRNKKMNIGNKPLPQFITFSFQIGGTIDATNGTASGTPAEGPRIQRPVPGQAAHGG